MEQYISKSAIVAEIERKINEINLDIIEDWRNRIQREHDIEVMKRILSLIDTLEVKEINSADAFIEKACEFFGEHLWKYINVKNANCDTFINIDGDKLKEDFKKYIKGE